MKLSMHVIEELKAGKRPMGSWELMWELNGKNDGPAISQRSVIMALRYLEANGAVSRDYYRRGEAALWRIKE